MNNISDFKKCSNCGACYSICPKSAINVCEDMFYKVSVDETKCNGCGLCKSVCPVNSPEKKQNLKMAYAMYNKDSEIVKKSSSGGVFHAIAKHVTDDLGGVVYAAAYSDDCREVVVKSTEDVSVYALMKSKYVESKVNLSFREIKEQISGGRTVLFCGAPCQVAGLIRFLGREYKNLITCDFSCGGMSSHKTYQEYLNYIEKKLKSKIACVDFRAKLFGWSRHSIKITGENGKEYKNFAFNDPYFYSFIGEGINKREYCLSCDFSNNHYSDIVLADFWAHKKVSKIKNDDTGLSLVIANSDKGVDTLEKIFSQVSVTVLDLEKASYNMKEREAKEEFIQRQRQFFEECQKEGFIKAMKKRKMPSKINLKTRFIIGKIKEKIF